MVVLHYTAMPTSGAALERLCDPGWEVSAHYLVGEDGTAVQLVEEAMRAWHAGAGAWGATCDVNSASIGIELANDGASPFPEPQMAALESLLAGVMARWGIGPERVVGHSDCAPLRKTDPGARFDWRRLAFRGLAVWPEAGRATADSAAKFETLARRVGYRCADPEALLRAVRLRFRPWAQGTLEEADRAVLADLTRRYPVDAAAAPA